MKSRKHDLNYPFDPAAVSDPACWLPVALAQKIPARFPMLRGIEPPRFQPYGVLVVSQHVTEDEFGTLHFQDGGPQ